MKNKDVPHCRVDWFLWDRDLRHERVQNFFRKCDQIRRKLIWSGLPKKYLMKYFVLCPFRPLLSFVSSVSLKETPNRKKVLSSLLLSISLENRKPLFYVFSECRKKRFFTATFKSFQSSVSIERGGSSQ